MSDRISPGALLHGFTGASFLRSHDAASGRERRPAAGQEASPATASRDARVMLAKHIYEMRRARDQFLPPDMFAEPAWDILLYLYGMHAAQHRATVTAVCASAGVPTSTALRWIQRLEIIGLIEKESHPTDNRISWVQLSTEGECQLDRFFDRLCSQTNN